MSSGGDSISIPDIIATLLPLFQNFYSAVKLVEIDPTDPTSTPKKRTAMGRFKHENAEVVINGDGRVVIYLGDDERGMVGADEASGNVERRGHASSGSGSVQSGFRERSASVVSAISRCIGSGSWPTRSG